MAQTRRTRTKRKLRWKSRFGSHLVLLFGLNLPQILLLGGTVLCGVRPNWTAEWRESQVSAALLWPLEVSQVVSQSCGLLSSLPDW